MIQQILTLALVFTLIDFLYLSSVSGYFKGLIFAV